MPTALFTINADSSDQGYDAEAEDVLTLRLKQLPPAGVATVLFQVFRAGGFDPDLGIAANPPRSSPGAPQLTLAGATSGQAVSPVAVDGAVTVTLPSEAGHSWIVRCVVNGGMGTLPDGRTGAVAGLVHERMIAVRDGNGCRAVVPTETTQYDDDGWAGALNEMRTLLGGGGGGVSDPLTVGTIYGPDSTPGAEAQVRLSGEFSSVGIGAGGHPFADGPVQNMARLAGYPVADVANRNTVDCGPDYVRLNIGVAGKAIEILAQIDDAASITLATFGAGYYLTAHEHSWSLNEGVAMVRARDDGGTMLLGFFGVEPTPQPEVANVEGIENLFNSLVEGLVALGLVTDGRLT
jgi:hypothetical protein